MVDIIHQPRLYKSPRVVKTIGVFQRYSESVFPSSAAGAISCCNVIFHGTNPQQVPPPDYSTHTNTSMCNIPVRMVPVGLIKSKFSIWVQFRFTACSFKIFFPLHFPALSYCAVLFTSPSSIRDLLKAEWRHTRTGRLTCFKILVSGFSFQAKLIRKSIYVGR